MAFKNKIRSMQRGAHKRDNKPRDATPDYQNFDPLLRDADKMQLGVNEREKAEILDRLGPKIRSYAKAGFKKPAEVARMLNNENIGTARGSRWSPRLVWFLLKLHYHKSAKVAPPRDSQLTGVVSRSRIDENSATTSLTREEMQRRVAALRAHLSNS